MVIESISNSVEKDEPFDMEKRLERLRQLLTNELRESTVSVPQPSTSATAYRIPPLITSSDCASSTSCTAAVPPPPDPFAPSTSAAAYQDVERTPIMTPSDSASSTSYGDAVPPHPSLQLSTPSTSAAAHALNSLDSSAPSTSAAAYSSAPSTSAAAYGNVPTPSKVARKNELTDSEEQLIDKLCKDIHDAAQMEKQQRILRAASQVDLIAAAIDVGSSPSVFTAPYTPSDEEEDPWEWMSLSSSPSDKGPPEAWPDDELDDDPPSLARDEDEDAEELESLHTLSEDPLVSEDDCEDYYAMAHLSEDRQMLKELLYLFSSSTCMFGDVTTDIKTWYLLYNTSEETVSYVLVGEASDGREFKKHFPDVYRNVKQVFTDNCHVYFTSRAVHGVAFEFVFVGSIPQLPDITGESSSGRNQLSLIALARKAVFETAKNSIGAACSRSIKRMNPPQFWTNYFLPALAQNWFSFGQGIEGGPDENKVLYGHILKRSQQLEQWNDERICLQERLKIKKKLLRMFPTFIRVPTECHIIPLLLEYLSFGMVTYINE